MGKSKKIDPTKVAAKKAKAAAKQEKLAIKANKKDLKSLNANEEDIETILAEFQEKEKARTTVTISTCDQPSPRSNFSLTALSNNEFLLFGYNFRRVTLQDPSNLSVDVCAAVSSVMGKVLQCTTMCTDGTLTRTSGRW